MWLLDDSRVFYLLCMYFYHYYIVMDNEIITQVNIVRISEALNLFSWN